MAALTEQEFRVKSDEALEQARRSLLQLSDQEGFEIELNDGTLNLFGALRTSMATTGYETLKEFQKAEVMVAPSLKTEGKILQQQQGIGMAR